MTEKENQRKTSTLSGRTLKDWVGVLKVSGADSRSTVFRVQKPRIVIGSVESADVRLGGSGVSPIHAVIELTREGQAVSTIEPMIFDLASATGVKLNGHPLVTSDLREGDRVEIAGYLIEFSLERADAVHAPVRTRVGERQLFRREDEDFSSLLQEPVPEKEIFDYSATARGALEIVMSWHGSILDVQHFVGAPQVRIGDRRENDFGIPSVLAQSSHVLVSGSGDSNTLHLDPKMKGIIYSQGRLQRLDGIGSQTIPLQKNDCAKVSVGEVDFYLAFTSAPPKLKAGASRTRDPLMLRTLMLSLLLTGAFFFSISRMGVPQQIEAEQLPERIATILYQPEKFSKPKSREVEKAEPRTATVPKAQPSVTKIDLKPNPENEKKPIPKEMSVGRTEQQPGGPKKSLAENKAKEGEGARAKGSEGSRGSKNAAPGKTPQKLAKRPSPQGGEGVGGGGKSEVQDIGNVDLLAGAGSKIQDLLGNSAARLGKDGSKVQGFGGFTTRGAGGQALNGTGQGGGGDADALAGGLGKQGRGGGRVGTGMGAAGDGSGIIGGKTRVVIRSGGPEEAVVMGSIDASAIEAALLAHKDEFRLCYEREINAENAKLAGRVGTSFVIGAQGRVTQAGVASTTLNHANTERCILNVIRRIDFPIPRGGGVVQVTYPFKFTPAGG